MLCIKNEHTDPCFNAAAEEHLFRNITRDCFMLYRNSPSIIVGKHQNTLAEINLDFVKKKNISVVRRLSGGGTVYHDLGNLNFTFTRNGEEGKLVDFVKFTEPILEVLNGLSVPARFEGVNDLRVGNRKISGNAEHVFKNRILHHGTLLFSTNLVDLNNALKIRPDLYRDKAVRSVRGNVANISEFLQSEITILEFRNVLFNHILSSFTGAEEYELNENDNRSIRQLMEEKYTTWEWNYGYSPRYQFQQVVQLGEKKLAVQLQVERGIIEEIHLADQESKESLYEMEKLLTGVAHNQEVIRGKLDSFDIDPFLPGINKKDLINAFF
jgi:lipoate-protein ligase A